MTGDKTKVELDLTKIDFPTDAISLGQLRRRQPHLFSRKGLSRSALIDLDAIPAQALEFELAEDAFRQAAGHADSSPKESRAELLEMLNEDYQRLGLSSGIEQTRQLARDFEGAAAAQAKASGRGR